MFSAYFAVTLTLVGKAEEVMGLVVEVWEGKDVAASIREEVENAYMGVVGFKYTFVAAVDYRGNEEKWVGQADLAALYQQMHQNYMDLSNWHQAREEDRDYEEEDHQQDQYESHLYYHQETWDSFPPTP